MMFGDFMMGARSRLLPMSIPMRFFGSAALFQCAAWALLLFVGDDAVGFLGGLGPLLAALHLVTLGVLAMTAMGAAFQLLPVATKRPVRSETACKGAYWLMLAGVLSLGHGMSTGAAVSLGAGAGLAVAALGLFGLLVADNLRRVKDMRVITDQAWIAVAALAGLLLLAVGLVVDDVLGGVVPDHQAVALAHAVLAGYGFMGLLVMGFSFVLVPMFGLTPPADAVLGRRAGYLSGIAVLGAVLGLLMALPALVMCAGLVGLIGAGMHLWAMAKLMKSRMRKQLGDSFILIRTAWGLLPLSILLGMAAEMGVFPDRLGPLFGFVLVFGWLLTFLQGILQRILPFLASMHSVRPGIKPILVSTLTADRPLRVHLVLHLTALLLVAAGLVGQWPWLVRLGGLSGLIASVCFAGFAAYVGIALKKHLSIPSTPAEK